MKSICISSIASNQGKTLLTTALLYHFKKSVRPFKIGPDYIDPQFHQAVCNTPSINLDLFMMNETQTKWLFQKYHDRNIAILEGVMGFYDGLDKGSSAYDLTKALNIPTLLLLDGSGSYITISAVLKGLKTYKEDNTIKAIILNKISSTMHYELIKKQILKDFDDIEVLGWIQKDIKTLNSTHLGLDLNTIKDINLEDLSKKVLQNIDLKNLEKISQHSIEDIKQYPFEKISKINRKISIVKDSNFSFLYHDNKIFLEELFLNVEYINSTKDEQISEDSSLVYIPGGYIETNEAYKKVKNSNKFKASLQKHAKTKHIYAECAGLLYLSKSVDEKKMSNLLDVEFCLTNKRVRLGYYFNEKDIKGHAFHYTKPICTKDGIDILSKKPKAKGEVASWKKNKVYGTYLHTTFRNNITYLKDYFGI